MPAAEVTFVNSTGARAAVCADSVEMKVEQIAVNERIGTGMNLAVIVQSRGIQLLLKCWGMIQLADSPGFWCSILHVFRIDYSVPVSAGITQTTSLWCLVSRLPQLDRISVRVMQAGESAVGIRLRVNLDHDSSGLQLRCHFVEIIPRQAGGQKAWTGGETNFLDMYSSVSREARHEVELDHDWWLKKTDHRLAFALIISGVSRLQIFDAQQNNSSSLHRGDRENSVRQLVGIVDAESGWNENLRFPGIECRGNALANHTSRTVNGAATSFWKTVVGTVEDQSKLSART